MSVDDPEARVRALCLALPEATEKRQWEQPTFRVRDKIFAMFGPHANTPGGAAIWCKAPPGIQEALIATNSERYFKPPYLGPKGWIGVVLTGPVDWDDVADLIRQSYGLIAPRKLAKLVEGD